MRIPIGSRRNRLTYPINDFHQFSDCLHLVNSFSLRTRIFDFVKYQTLGRTSILYRTTVTISWAALCSAALCSAVRCGAVLCFAVLCCVLCCVEPCHDVVACSAVQCHAVLSYAVLGYQVVLGEML